MVRVLITGGAGFIGSNLVDYLLGRTDWNIRVFDNLSSGDFDRVRSVENFDGDRVEFFEGNITDEDRVMDGVDGCDYVVNLAAQVGVMPSIENPFNDAEINIFGVLNLLEASRKHDVDHFIHGSSAAPLGETEMPIHEKRIPQPLSPYGASKLSGEAYCSAYTGSYNLNTTALRFSNVYGPHSTHKQSVVHLFIKQTLNNQQIKIYGDGEQTRDYIHVKDIAQGIHKTIKNTKKGHNLIQLGTGKETTVNQLYNKIKQIFQQKNHKVPKPKHENPRQGEIYKNYTSIKKAKQTINYKPTKTLKQGLKNTIKWYIKNS